MICNNGYQQHSVMRDFHQMSVQHLLSVLQNELKKIRAKICAYEQATQNIKYIGCYRMYIVQYSVKILAAWSSTRRFTPLVSTILPTLVWCESTCG